MIVSGATAGAILGALSSSSLNSSLGRKKTLLACDILFVAGAVAMAMSDKETLWLLILGRLIVGVGVGIASSTAPVYISECAPSAYRGRLITCYGILIVCGQAVAYLVAYLLGGDTLNGWRWMLALGGVPALLQAVGMFYLPESPRWLAANGKLSAAKEVLDKLRGTDAQAELRHIESSVASANNTGSKEGGGEGGNSCSAKIDEFRKIWRNPGVRTALVTGVSLQLFQQIIGINAIMYYSGITFQNMGFDDRDALLMSLTVASVGMLSSISSLRLIDALGRRKLLLLSNLGVIVCLGAVGIAFAYKNTWLNVTAQCAYVAFFQCGLGPIPWTMNAEIYPLWARSMGSGISTFVNWTFTLLVSATFLTIHDAVGDGNVFLIYGGCSVVALIYFYLRVPETKGLSLEEVEKLFQDIARKGSYRAVVSPH